jgi:hypothetical protein
MINEVASGLLDLGHDLDIVTSTLGIVFDASAQEIVSGLTSAGVAAEHAVSTTFGDAGAELASRFGFVGSSITSLATDSCSADLWMMVVTSVQTRAGDGLAAKGLRGSCRLCCASSSDNGRCLNALGRRKGPMGNAADFFGLLRAAR